MVSTRRRFFRFVTNLDVYFTILFRILFTGIYFKRVDDTRYEFLNSFFYWFKTSSQDFFKSFQKFNAGTTVAHLMPSFLTSQRNRFRIMNYRDRVKTTCCLYIFGQILLTSRNSALSV